MFQPDPTTYLWMHDQELSRTMRQNALERAVKDSKSPGEGFSVARFDAAIRGGIKGLRRVLRPAGTGSA